MQPSRKTRVLHFVNGNVRSGAMHVAIQLVKAALASERIEPLLVLRRKRRTHPETIAAELKSAGVPVHLIRRSRVLTMYDLVNICREFQPDVLLAHGFSEHLWGRYAGLLAGVPHLVHVEHNTREPYNFWLRMQTRWLAKRSARIVGVSEGVREVLLEMGLPSDRTIAIPNGIDLLPFADAALHPLPGRIPGVVMAARLHKQKDHPCLLRAIAILRERGLVPPVLLAGSGGGDRQASLEQLSTDLGLNAQVHFLGQRQDVHQLLLSHRICVLISHWEGFGLALVEGMAAGCAVIASNVPGMREIITDGEDGLLVPPDDPAALADALERLLRDDALAIRLGAAARQTAISKYGRDTMNACYEQLYLGLARA